MTFSEAVQAMLDGKKVKRLTATGYGYITLDDEGNVVDNIGNPFNFSEKDFIGDWRLGYSKEDIISGGDELISKDENNTHMYRVVAQPDGRFMIIDSNTWIVLKTDIEKDKFKKQTDELGLFKISNFSGTPSNNIKED